MSSELAMSKVARVIGPHCGSSVSQPTGPLRSHGCSRRVAWPGFVSRRVVPDNEKMPR
jgi:hypothetical protein